jgi:hypothetical protein
MSLKFDGKSNWKAFYAKFSRYAEVSEWTEGECRDQLCWCLDGIASEYYALLVERNQDMAYMDLIRKLEKRFGLSFESRVLLGWTLSHSFPSPVPTVPLPSFSPD